MRILWLACGAFVLSLWMFTLLVWFLGALAFAALCHWLGV
jgi:hypothetical protein